MKKILTTILITSAFLTACGERGGPSPIDSHVQQFNQDQRQSNSDFGLDVVNVRMGLTNLNCTAFDRAAQTSVDTLGSLSAKTEAMLIKGLAGCGDVSNNMIQYERARRDLKYGWDYTLSQLSDTERILFQNHGAGQLIESQIVQVFTEEQACLFTRAADARLRGRSNDIRELRVGCRGGISEAQQCQLASHTNHAHYYAGGQKDYLAYLSETFSRYKSMYLHCTPGSAQEYVGFHSTVPAEVFERAGARFKTAIDPMLNCYLGKARDLISKNRSFSANTLYKTCARDFNVSTLYTQEDLPRISTPELMRGTSTSNRGWLFDPSRAHEDPQTWTFGDCENTMIEWMGQNGFNMVKPDSVKNYCNNMQRQIQQDERRNFRR